MHTIPDEAGRFDIWLECVAQKLWEEGPEELLVTQ